MFHWVDLCKELSYINSIDKSNSLFQSKNFEHLLVAAPNAHDTNNHVIFVFVSCFVTVFYTYHINYICMHYVKALLESCYTETESLQLEKTPVSILLSGGWYFDQP